MDDYKAIKSFLEGLCAKREYCVSDIRRKALDRLEGDREKAEELVASLIADKFVDDARYASAFAREKASLQGWGPIKIRFQLRAKGISDAVISRCAGGDRRRQGIRPPAEAAGEQMEFTPGRPAGAPQTVQIRPHQGLRI